jgi:hypothetical protein
VVVDTFEEPAFDSAEVDDTDPQDEPTGEPPGDGTDDEDPKKNTSVDVPA